MDYTSADDNWNCYSNVEKIMNWLEKTARTFNLSRPYVIELIFKFMNNRKMKGYVNIESAAGAPPQGIVRRGL